MQHPSKIVAPTLIVFSKEGIEVVPCFRALTWW